MPVVNPLARELVFKIVYYGPGLGGKTTTLQHVHASTKPEYRGKMVSLATPVDRTLYFDFLPIRVPSVRGMGVRLQLFTVPGQVYYNATRKLVLTGADGVVLVCDSQKQRADANLESLENLCDNLREHGRSLEDVPHVIQLNKRDLTEISSVDDLGSKLNRHDAPQFETIATRGQGVYEALESITRLVLDDFEKRIPESQQIPEQSGLELPEGGLTEALRRANGDDGGPSLDTALADAARAHGTNRPPPDFPSRVPPGPEVMHGENAARAVTGLGALHQPDVTPSPAPPDEPLEDATMESRQLTNPGLGGPRAVRPRPAMSPPPPAPEPAPAKRPSRPPKSIARPAPTGAPTAAWSFEAIWPAGERATVRDLEQALANGDHARAVDLAELLVSRAFAGAAHIIGSTTDAPRDPAVVPLLLGLDGRRYLEFRALVRDARAGRAVSQVEALEAYSFAVEARLARSKVGA